MGVYSAATLLSLALLLAMPRCHSGALSMQQHGPVGKPVGTYGTHAAHPLPPPRRDNTSDDKLFDSSEQRQNRD
jgi:hypothetical protein